MRLGQIIAFYREYAAIITNVSPNSDNKCDSHGLA